MKKKREKKRTTSLAFVKLKNGLGSCHGTSLTHYLEIAHLAYHGIRVHLTHVVTTIVLMGLVHVQQPCVGIVIGNAVTWYP